MSETHGNMLVLFSKRAMQIRL
uniref:Uncharacterized protein n=1 Tax=Anguilla anguilla TaxID=7936 RepID=A0A0E9QD30_ANGAN